MQQIAGTPGPILNARDPENLLTLERRAHYIVEVLFMRIAKLQATRSAKIGFDTVRMLYVLSNFRACVSGTYRNTIHGQDPRLQTNKIDTTGTMLERGYTLIIFHGKDFKKIAYRRVMLGIHLGLYPPPVV